MSQRLSTSVDVAQFQLNSLVQRRLGGSTSPGGGGGGGNVTGPGPTVNDNEIARYDGPSGLLIQAGTSTVLLDTGAIGLGTLTVPHAGVGAPSTMLALEAAGGGGAGPHIMATVTGSDDPIVQYFHGGHGNVAMCFDTYHTGPGGGFFAGLQHGAMVWLTGSGASPWDGLRIMTHANSTPGAAVTLRNRMRFNENGINQLWGGPVVSLLLGSDVTDFGKNSTGINKNAHIACPHREFADETGGLQPVSMISATITGSLHTMLYGGGSTLMTCMNVHRWFTAPNQTDIVGVERMHLSEAGQLYHGPIADNEPYLWAATSGGITEITGDWCFLEPVCFKGSTTTPFAAGITTDPTVGATEGLKFASHRLGSGHGFQFRTLAVGAAEPNRLFVVVHGATDMVRMAINWDGDMYGTGTVAGVVDEDNAFISEKRTNNVTTGDWSPSAGIWDWSALTAGETNFIPPDNCINLRHMVHQAAGGILSYRKIPADNVPTVLPLPPANAWTLMSDDTATLGFRWVDPAGPQPSSLESLLQFDGGKGSADEDSILYAFDEGEIL